MIQNNRPFFSIIIPTFNREKLVIECIKSFLKQKYKNFELIIVDDGSTDDTKNKILNLKSKKLKYFKIKNSERGYARNYGIRKAKGIYLNFCDSDDFVYSNHLYEAKNILKKKYEIICFNYHILENLFFKTINNKNINKDLIKGNPLMPACIFFKKDIFNKYKFDSSKKLSGSEDYYLWLQLLTKYVFQHHNISTSVLRIHQNRSMNNLNALLVEKRISYLIKKIKFNKQIKKKFKAKIKTTIAFLYLHICLVYTIQKKNHKAIKYLIKAKNQSLLVLFSYRFLIIIKKIFFNVWN